MSDNWKGSEADAIMEGHIVYAGHLTGLWLFPDASVNPQVIDRAIEQHQIEAAEFLAEWERTSRAEAWAAWEAEVGATGRLNKQKAKEVEEERARHFAAVAKGKSIVHAAREEFDRKVAQEQSAHEAKVVVLREEHDKECAQLVADQKAAQKQALLDWVTLKRKAEMTNQENLTKARRQFQRDEQKVEHEAKEKALRLEEEHAAAVVEAREHNKAVQPLLDKAAIALRELKRVEAFSANISRCAEKMYVGVNLKPTPTPQLDRVVEMSSLLESLRLAYEEYPMGELPWPNRAQPGMPVGTGCWSVTATPRQTLGRVVEPSAMLKTLSAEADRRLSARHRQAILEASGNKGSQISPRPPRTPRQGEENITRIRPLSSHRRRLSPSSMPSQELRSRPKTAPLMGRMIHHSYASPPRAIAAHPRPKSGRAGVSPRARLAQEWFIPDPVPPKDLRQAKKVTPPSARRRKNTEPKTTDAL